MRSPPHALLFSSLNLAIAITTIVLRVKPVDVSGGKVQKVYHDNDLVKSVTLAPQLVARIIPSSKEDRVLVGLEQVPEALLDTLLLVEDRDFYFIAVCRPWVFYVLYTAILWQVARCKAVVRLRSSWLRICT